MSNIKTCKYCEKSEAEILIMVLECLIQGEAEHQLHLNLDKKTIEEICDALIEDEEHRLLFLIQDVINEVVYEKSTLHK